MGSFSQGPRCAASVLRSKDVVKSTQRALIRIGWISLCFAAYATTVTAQTAARVTRDQANIWKSDFVSPAAVVRMGTVLTIVGRRGDWYEVVVPGTERATGATTGFIFVKNVEVVRGSPPSAATPGQITTAQPPSPRSRAVGLWGFGQFGYTRFTAHDSFQAVLGKAGGAFVGGGVEVRLRSGFFVNGSVEHFTQTGQRVVVVDREVFRLGIPDTVTMTPITLSAGWRLVRDGATPYMGAGTGKIFYRETSSFADADENVDERFTSYHILGGVEFRNGWVATAFEVQYSRVPDALGVGGASAAFEERDLGGFEGRVKILLGR